MLQVLAPFAIGFTVFVCHLIAIPIDNCSINRAARLLPLLCVASLMQLRQSHDLAALPLHHMTPAAQRYHLTVNRGGRATLLSGRALQLLDHLDPQ